MGARRRGSAAADAGVGAPCALRRPARPPDRRRAVRPLGNGPRAVAGVDARPPAARAGRERDVERDGDSQGDLDRPQRGDRRGADDVAARLGSPARRGREEGDRRQVGRRPARLDRPPSAPCRGGIRRRRQAEDAGGSRAPRGVAGRRDRRGGRVDRRGDARTEPSRAGGDDHERLRLRRLRRSRVHARRSLPPHTRGIVLRQAGPEAVPPGARRLGSRRRDGPLRRRLPPGRPGVHGGARARRQSRARRVRAAAPLARAPARLRRAAAADPGRGRTRARHSLGEGVRVPRRRAADPRGGAAGRRRRAADPGHGRRHRRRTGRRRGAA